MLHLQVLYANSDADTVTFKVSQQDQRGFEPFKASNGIMILSVYEPYWSGDRGLYVRGKDHQYDDEKMTCTFKDWLLIVAAVHEFNSVKRDYIVIEAGSNKLVSIMIDDGMTLRQIMKLVNTNGYDGFTVNGHTITLKGVDYAEHQA